MNLSLNNHVLWQELVQNSYQQSHINNSTNKIKKRILHWLIATDPIIACTAALETISSNSSYTTNAFQ